MSNETKTHPNYFELGFVIGKLWADKCGENDCTIQKIRRSFTVVEEEKIRISEGKRPRGIATTVTLLTRAFNGASDFHEFLSCFPYQFSEGFFDGVGDRFAEVDESIYDFDQLGVAIGDAWTESVERHPARKVFYKFTIPKIKDARKGQSVSNLDAAYQRFLASLPEAFVEGFLLRIPKS